jgi:hypothetical protein
VVVLVAGVLAARRTAIDALLVWVGLALLAVSALHGAVLSVEAASWVFPVGDLRFTVDGGPSMFGTLPPPLSWRLFALDAFFAGLRVLGAAIVTLGVIRCARPVSV